MEKEQLQELIENNKEDIFSEIKEEISDETVTDIEWDGYNLWITQLGRGCYISMKELSDRYMDNLSIRLANIMGASFNRMHPILEANTESLRISIWHESRCGRKSMAIRKIPQKLRFGHADLVRSDYAPESIITLLENCVTAHLSTVIGGQPHAGKTELQTSEEPYEYHFLLEQNKETLKVKTGTEESKLNQEMSRTAVLMLALIDNLGEVQWNYAMIAEDGTENDVLYTSYVDIDSAQQWLGVDNIKAYAESPEKMQEFLNLLDTVSGDAIEGANTEIDGTASITHREGFQNATLHYYVPKSSEGIVTTTGIYTEEEAEAHAQRAVQEIYDLTGFQVTECYYYAYDFGTVDLSMSEDDLEHSRIFYSRCFADLPGDTTSIASAYLANAQKVWYSPVKMMILPDRYDMMSEGEKAVWFVTHSGQYNGQKVYATYQDYADQPETWTVVMDDETVYEITLEADTNSFSNLTGPYPDGNIRH